MSSPVRVRFAPAPTGYLHVGGARSALFNWLFARHHGGNFVLRIEDTNAELNRPELIEAILEPLRWLGIDWDEGPFYQSQRSHLYVAAIDQLLSSGAAYLCDCTQDDVKARAETRGAGSGYDGHCRAREVADGAGVVVRFRMPDAGSTVVDDLIRGRVEFSHADLEDFVIRRGDGTPVFLVANAVDDADMGITHAIRGEDLLNTTPKVMLLWEALGYGPPPVYAHLPLLVNEQRKKLSKRRDDVALGDYMDRGYLAEAMANYLALLGWGPSDDVEIRPMSEIIELFRLEDVNKASAFFDPKKLDHVNATYIRALPAEEFCARAEPWMTNGEHFGAECYDAAAFLSLAPMVQERVRTLSEAPALVDWVFGDVPDDPDSWAKAMTGEVVPAVLDGVIEAFETVDWEADLLDATVREVGDRLGAKSGVPVRVAVTGRRAGIPVYEAMTIMGRDAVLARLRAARARL
ncbi:MAG: glutamate--tRNA ligase [Acidimicrobiales bacterium]|nr:glutamate--tRNA ligase [Acidimicrobiales bacterium]